MSIRILFLATLVLSGGFASALMSQAQTMPSCTQGTGKAITATLAFSQGGFDDQPRHEVTLLLLPGGTAEYTISGTCTVLAFTGVRAGDAVYTDDGLGRGLTVSVGEDDTLTVTHAAGWTAKSQ